MTNLPTVPSKSATSENSRTEIGNFFQTTLNNEHQAGSFSDFDDLLEKENSEINSEELLSQNKNNQKSKQILLEQINACHIYNYDQKIPKIISDFDLNSSDLLDSKFEINKPVNITSELNSLAATALASAQIPSSGVSSPQPSSSTPTVPATDLAPTALTSAQIPSLDISAPEPSSLTPTVPGTDLAPDPLTPAQTPSSGVFSSQESTPLSLEEENTENFALNSSKEENSPHPAKTQELLLSSSDKNHITPATKPSPNQTQDFSANKLNSLLQSAQSEEKLDQEATHPLSNFFKPNSSENLTQSPQIPASSKIENPLEFNNIIKTGEVTSNNNQQTNQSHLGSQVGSLFKTLSTEVEKFQQTGQTNIQLDLKVSDNEDIKIRLTLRGGEIRSTFITESPELRDALQKAWPEFSQNSRDKGHRFSDPAFQQAFQDNNANSKEQRRSPNQHFTDTGTEDAPRINEIASRRQMTTKPSNRGNPQPALWA